MKTIGIRLADGAFYPVLQEGSSAEKTLELTTVHNNQTKIMVDLYRSEAGHMDDAEYVDSLQIDGISSHTEDEPRITFTVSIDKNNRLNARILDRESGAKNSTSLTLVERPLKERKAAEDAFSNSEDEKTTVLAENGVKVLSDTTPAKSGIGLLATAEALLNKENAEEEEQAGAEEVTDVTAAEAPVTEKEPAEAEAELSEPDPEQVGMEKEQETEPEEPEMDDLEKKAEDDFSLDLPDIDTALENDASDPLPDFSLNLDDFDLPETPAADNAPTEDDTFTLDEPFAADSTSADEKPAAEEPATEDALPDFDFDLPEPDADSDTTADSEAFSFGLPEESSPNFEDMPEPADIPSSGAFDFASLYDDEPSFDDSEDEENQKKGPRILAVIAVLLAILILLATLALLFIIPSPLNLRTRSKKPAQTAVVTAPVVPEAAPEPEPVEKEELPPPPPEPIKEPEVEEIPPAQEDEIVIIEKAEEVIPQQPPAVEEKPKDIVYKIKWGDTLWDIANTYYKNPWRYKDIAKFNGIKDPDHIISGTTIIIPAE